MFLVRCDLMFCDGAEAALTPLSFLHPETEGVNQIRGRVLFYKRNHLSKQDYLKNSSALMG